MGTQLGPAPFFCELEAVEEHMHVVPAQHAFLNRNQQGMIDFLSKPCVLLLQVMMLFYSSAASVGENKFATAVVRN